MRPFPFVEVGEEGGENGLGNHGGSKLVQKGEDNANLRI
jgi:hypothetical protein